MIAYIAIAVKKKVENSAQKVWWRIALFSVQPLSTKPASAFCATCGEPAANIRHGSNSSGASMHSATMPNH